MISAKQIQELRARTGVGMAKCKEALEESKGDMELAISNLRKAGIASATKKEGRETKEGMIAFHECKEGIAFIEINSETDFVAKNEQFQKFLQEMVQTVAERRPDSLEAFLADASPHDHSLTIDQYRSLMVQTIGENIKIQRIAFIARSSNSSWACYSHMNGKLVTFVEIAGSESKAALAKEIAMHTAAEAPSYLAPEDVPAHVRTQEEEIAAAQVLDKPEQIRSKIVAGKLNAFYDQFCLLRQKFIKDPSLSIEELLKRESGSGQPLRLVRFLRWKVGEGS